MDFETKEKTERMAKTNSPKKQKTCRKKSAQLGKYIIQQIPFSGVNVFEMRKNRISCHELWSHVVAAHAMHMELKDPLSMENGLKWNFASGQKLWLCRLCICKHSLKDLFLCDNVWKWKFCIFPKI